MVKVKGLYDKLAVKGVEYFAKLRFYFDGYVLINKGVGICCISHMLHLSNLRLMLSAHPLEIEANIPKLIRSK